MNETMAPAPPSSPVDSTPDWGSPEVNNAIIVSVVAGLATAVGGALVFFPSFFKSVRQTTILAVALALSAGVMLYVSFIEIFVKSYDAIQAGGPYSDGLAGLYTTLSFFAGMFICVILELIVHGIQQYCDGPDLHGHGSSHDQTSTAHGICLQVEPTAPSSTSADETEAKGTHEEPSAVLAIEEIDLKSVEERRQLHTMGIMTALAIGIHNFPEGLATFLATVDDAKVGISLGVAIAVHNVPEGICVAMPIYYATGSKCKGFMWAFISGLTEPLGGLIGFAVLQPFFTDLIFGVVFSMVGGMMVFIVCHELLPSAHRYMGKSWVATAWLIVGMVVMAISLVLFNF